MRDEEGKARGLTGSHPPWLPTLVAMDVVEKGGRETSDLDQKAVRGERVAESMEGRGGGLLEPS